MEARDLEYTEMKHAESKRIFLTPSCMNFIVLDILEDDAKESSNTELGENVDKNETRIYKYVGETNRSSYERGSEHLADMRLIKPGSHLLKHVLDKHEGETLDEVDFRMKVVNDLQLHLQLVDVMDGLLGGRLGR